ncbi:hypothetical protein ACT2FY_44080 [Paraburkholderia fungorum]|uniref:hypothetical protein n=1 Tax=Paraburkholderia fungorum TaxID=134537 RepID=UPI00402BDD9A
MSEHPIVVHTSGNAPKWRCRSSHICLMHWFGALHGVKISRLHVVRCVHSLQTRAPCGFAPGWRIHGTEAALLVPIDLCQQAFMFILNDPGVDAPGWVS